MPSAEATAATVRTTYRHLLRGINAATHFSRPAGKNLQRLYRTQYEQEEREEQPGGGHEKAQRTLLFLLSASHSPIISSAAAATWKEAYLAHPSTFAKFDTFRSQRALRQEARSVNKKRDATPKEHGSRELPVPEASLAGSRPPKRSEGSRRTLAQKVTTNLASLTYHHLSPNTRMMGLHKRAGGTDPSTVPKLTKSRLKASGIFSEEEVEEMMMSGDSHSSRAMNKEHLHSLIVPPKPITGPKLPTGTPHMRWNGQRPVQSFSPAAAAIGTTPGSDVVADTDEIKRLQTRVDELGQRYKALKDASGSAKDQSPSSLSSSFSKPRKGKGSNRSAEDELTSAKEALTQVRGKLKSATKAAQKQREEGLMKLLPIQALHTLVRDAEKSSGVWLGATRFGMRARGEWLPP